MRVFIDDDNELAPTEGCLLEQDCGDRRYCLETFSNYGNPLCFVAPIEGVRMGVTTLIRKPAGAKQVGRVLGEKIVVVKTNYEKGAQILQVPKGVRNPKDAFYFLSNNGSIVNFVVPGQKLALDLSLTGTGLRVGLVHEGDSGLLVAKLNRLATLDPCFVDVREGRFTEGDVELTRFADFGGLLEEVRRTTEVSGGAEGWPEVKMLMLNPKSDS